VKRKTKNKTDAVANPHDRFFKEMFSSREIARSFLVNYLPPEICPLIDTHSVELSKDSYIDSRLRSQFSDLLYRVALSDGRDAHVYVLFEHKSQPDDMIGWYLLSCMVRIWRQDMRMVKDKKLRAIIPFVVYHGTKEWTAGFNFQDLFDVPDVFKRFIPGFEYCYCNFQPNSEEPVRGSAQLRVALLLLKTIYRPDLIEQLPVIFGLIRDVPQDKFFWEFLESILTYISSATDQMDESYLGYLIEDVALKTGGEIMPTLYDKWVQKGSQKTARESVVEILEIRFGNRPPQVMTWLNQLTDVPTLKGLLREAATTQSIGEFEKRLKNKIQSGVTRSSDIQKD
jgi:predicted transposase/invertase (TIGR01784 family)